MESNKFENKIKNLLEERELQPSAQSWDRLEQRMEHEKGASKPYFLWIGAAAAIAVVFFLLGGYFNNPIVSETPQIVNTSPVEQAQEEKTIISEEIEIPVSEIVEAPEETSRKIPAKNVIFETPVSEASQEELAVNSQNDFKATEAVEQEISAKELYLEDLKTDIAAQDFSSEVSDLEVEALLLLATAELKADAAYSVKAEDLLHEVEYELEQSFRQKVFEVVKEGLLKAKTAVANRDF